MVFSVRWALMGAPLLAALILLIPDATWRTFFMTLGVIAAVLVFVFRWGVARFDSQDFAVARQVLLVSSRLPPEAASR